MDNINHWDMSRIYHQIAEWPERVKTLRPENRATDPNREIRHLLASPDGTSSECARESARLLVLSEMRGDKGDASYN